MTNLLLVDLDGTVRRPVSAPNGFINSPVDQEIIPEAAAALRRYAANGFEIVGCSNQGGVDAGHKTIGACIDEQFETMRLAGTIDSILFCPEIKGGQVVQVTRRGAIMTATMQTFAESNFASFRKPDAGMLQLAMFLRHAEPANTLFTGDRLEDEEAARRAGVRFLPRKLWYASQLTRAV